MNMNQFDLPSPVQVKSKSAIGNDLSVRIELARILLISAIVIHHLRIPAELSLYSWDNLGYLRGFLQIGIFKTATSTLTVISGYLCFSNTFENAPGKFISKKFRTLFVPMLVWNIPFALLLYYYQSKGAYAAKYDDLASGDIFNWLNALLGLTRSPADEPLHFLRNLFACNVLALAIAGLFRRHALAVFGVIVIVGVLNLDGPIFTRDDILIGFFFGGLAAVHGLDIDYFDKWLVFTIPAYLAGAFLIFAYNESFDSLIWLPHRALGFVVAWPLIGRIARTGPGIALSSYSKYAFFLFLTHYYVVIFLYKMFERLFTLEQFYIYFLFSLPLTIMICVWGQKLLFRLFPETTSFLTGDRVTGRMPR